MCCKIIVGLLGIKIFAYVLIIAMMKFEAVGCGQVYMRNN